MKTIWTSHLDSEEEKERFRKKIRSSRSVLERINEILDLRLKAINSIETGVEIYTKPGWEALLVHYNTEKGVLNWVKNLINLDQEGKNNDRESSGRQPRTTELSS